MADIYEYWIGRNTNYDGIWEAYDNGRGYIQKYHSMRVHLIQIKVSQHPKELPLFNHEAVFKTIKGYFHDLKLLCLDRDTYNSAGPLFIYSIERASGIWEFLGELRQLLLFGTTLADEKIVGEKLSNLDKRMEFLRKHFGNAITPEDFQRFMKAKAPRQLEKAVQRLIQEEIENIQISQKPFVGNIEDTKSSLIDVKSLLNEADEGKSAS